MVPPNCCAGAGWLGHLRDTEPATTIQFLVGWMEVRTECFYRASNALYLVLIRATNSLPNSLHHYLQNPRSVGSSL